MTSRGPSPLRQRTEMRHTDTKVQPEMRKRMTLPRGSVDSHPKALRTHAFRFSGPKDDIIKGFWAILSLRAA